MDSTNRQRMENRTDLARALMVTLFALLFILPMASAPVSAMSASTLIHFNVFNAPTITLNAPVNSSSVNVPHILLNYTVSDPDADLVGCNVYADTSPDPTTLVNSTTLAPGGERLFNLIGLADASEYHWKFPDLVMGPGPFVQNRGMESPSKRGLLNWRA